MKIPNKEKIDRDWKPQQQASNFTLGSSRRHANMKPNIFKVLTKYFSWVTLPWFPQEDMLT